MSDAVEAMARAIRAARFPWEAWQFLPPASQAAAIEEARAAIRAVTERGGLVVGKVPGSMPFYHDDTDDRVFEKRGYNAALAAVRASAVEVE